MAAEAISFNSLLIITLLAAFVPLIVKKISFFPVPIVVGEILVGMIVGKSGFNLIAESAWLDFLYTFGFAFLMFLSGLEIDFKLMRPTVTKHQKKWYRKPAVLAFVIFIGTVLSSLIMVNILTLLGLSVNKILLTLVLSTTSLGIVVPILKEKDMLSSEYGQTILLASLIADFATMVLITLFVTLYTSKATYQVLLVLLLFVAFFFFYKMGKILVGRVIIEELAHATSQIKVRGAIALIVIFIALAQTLGSEIILGAFLAGVIVSLLNERENSQLSFKLDAIGYGFFIPIFFIMVGAHFDIRAVLNSHQSIVLLPAFLIAVYAVKLIPALVLRINHSWRESVAAGFLLSSRLSLIIAASAIGLKLGLISKEVNGTIILVAVITCTFSPLLFNQISDFVVKKSKKRVFIIGVTGTTILLAKRIRKMDIEVSLITDKEKEFERYRKSQEKVLLGNPMNVDWLTTIGLGGATTVVISYGVDEMNSKICRICKESFGIDNLVVIMDKLPITSDVENCGAKMVSPEFATVFMAENFVTNPQALCLLLEVEEDFFFQEVILKNSNYYNKPLSKLNLPGDCLILSIIRDYEKIIPHGNTVLRSGDLIMMVGAKEYVNKAGSILEGFPG